MGTIEKESNSDKKKSNSDNQFGKYLISCLVGALILLHLFVPSFRLDIIGFALVLIALSHWALPFVSRYVKSISVSKSGARFEFLEKEVKQQSFLFQLCYLGGN